MRDYNIRDIKVCNTELQMICESRLFKLYGENIPKDVLVRFEEECKLIVKNGFSRYYLQAKQVIDELSLKQHQFFCKGMVANSFVAYLLGISSVDPISNSLCFELFSGSQGNKYPYFEFIIADMKRKQARELLNELEIDYKVIRCRRMDVLDFLERYKHYSKDIYENRVVDDKFILSYLNMRVVNSKYDELKFGPNPFEHIPTLCSALTRRLIEIFEPKTMSEFADVIALSSANEMWSDEFEIYVEKNNLEISDLICTRDDIFELLYKSGMGRDESLLIYEQMKKCRGLTPIVKETLEWIGVEEWKIQCLDRVRFLHSRAYALEYAKVLLNLCYFLFYYPDGLEQAKKGISENRKIKMYLKGKEIDTLDELKENFQIYEVMEYIKRGTLRQWLFERNETELLESVRAVVVMPAKKRKKRIYDIFGIAYDGGEVFTQTDRMILEARKNINYTLNLKTE